MRDSLVINPSLQGRTHPIRFLLYLEWILLAIIGFSEVLAHPVLRFPKLPLLNLVCLALFLGMGLRLPSNKFLSKAIYTSLEIWLILLSSIVGFISLFPFLYVILIIRNCFIFRRQMRLIVTGIAFLLFLLTTLYRTKNFPLSLPRATPYRLESLVFSLALLFGLVLLFLQLLVDAILSERQSREQLAKANVQLELANAQLRQYALRIEDIATLQERNRIARDIHDSLGHSLSILNLHLEAALKLWKTEPEEATEFLTEAKSLGSRALDDVRQSVFALRSDPLEGQSLEEAIASLTGNFFRSTSIQPNINIDLSHSIPPEVKIVVYRIVQEALTNIYKYAGTTEVDIQVKTKNDLQLMISDNGRGFDLTQNTSGFGLQGMCERTQALGGQFEVVTSPGCGCKIIANFPLPLL
jgi:signal transduction histidine kinase